MASTVYDPMDRAGLEFWLHTQAGDNSERRRRLLRNLPKAVAAELTPRQREVLALYMERDMNVTQIAAVLGVNKSTVSRSLHRALRRLERCLRYSFCSAAEREVLDISRSATYYIRTVHVPYTYHLRILPVLLTLPLKKRSIAPCIRNSCTTRACA